MTSVDRCVIAVDLGGTTIKGIAMDAQGGVRGVLTLPTVIGRVLEAIVELLLLLRDRVERDGATVVGVAVISPGLVDEDTGCVAYAANLGWRDVALREVVERNLQLPVAVGHDVRVAGTAEHRLGAARGVDDFALIQLGTGVAAALVTGRTVVRGAARAGGEFGHMPVIPGGEQCACGQRGCLEAYASASAIARRYALRTGSALTSERVVARVSTDPDAAAVWGESIDVLAHGLVSLTMLFDPSLIVIGGGLSRAGDALTAPLTRRISELMTWREAPVLATSSLGSNAGRLGAALLAFQAAGHVVDTATWSFGFDAADALAG